MPEYLAPGVYVEETSFRSKTIEGVSTTTTAFVGATLKGPFGDVPELLTSFGDFERIYGGLGDVDGETNYVAHAVRAFFDNGGSRLYVSRVVPVDGNDDPNPPAESFAASADLLAPDGDPTAQFIARFPGEGGNGEVILFEQAVPASDTTLNSAPQGSIVRLLSGGSQAAQPAQVEGSAAAPFALSNGDVLTITLDGSDESITFRGQPAEAVSAAALGATVDLSATESQVLTVQIGADGAPQTIALPTAAAMDVAEVLATINQQLRGGYARLTTASDSVGANFLAIGTDVRGTAAQIRVNPNSALQFTAPDPVTVTASADSSVNNVADLGAVTIAEIQQLLTGNSIDIGATAGSSNQLILQTTATGSSATFAIADTPAAAALGLTPGASTPGQDGSTARYFTKTSSAGGLADWVDQSATALTDTDLNPASGSTLADIITLSAIARDSSGTETVYDGLGLAPEHPMWIGNVLPQTPNNRTDAVRNPFAFRLDGAATALELRSALAPAMGQEQNAVEVALAPGATLGNTASVGAYRAALQQLESLEDISIIAAPGYSAIADETVRFGIQDVLITTVSRRRAYQIAVLDAPQAASLTEVRALRSRIDTTYAALYYPWVVVANPLAQPGRMDIPRELPLPPSGFICGIYARNDIERGVYKAPANEVVRGALRFEFNVNFGQQEVLNPQGINCLRFFPGRGYRVWGARLATSDSEVKYVSDRRYLNYLERSIDIGTQFAVFEPNGERLWSNIRDTIAAFLYNEWFSGALFGSTPQEAFFVRCDRSTMTQADLDNGRLICLVGVALLKPAEFVIFRIGQAVLSGN